MVEKIYKDEDVQADVLKFGREKILKLINRLREFRNTIYKMIRLKNQIEKENCSKTGHEDNFRMFLQSKKSPKINSIEQILNLKEREYLSENSVISEFKQKKFCYKNNTILIEDMNEKFYIEEDLNSSKENNIFITKNNNTALPKISNAQTPRNNANSVLNNNIPKLKFEKNVLKTSRETKEFKNRDSISSQINILSFEDAIMRKIKKIERNTYLCSSTKNESTFLTTKNESDDIDFNSLVGNYKKPLNFTSNTNNDLSKKKDMMNKVNCRLVKWKQERVCPTEISIKEEKDDKIPHGVKQLPSFKVRSSLNYIYHNIKKGFNETHSERKVTTNLF